MISLWLAPPEGDPIRVEKSPAMVGRDPGVDIVIDHSSVSRRHALLERSGESWVVADQKSGNGTWIDGQRIIKAILRTGQSLRFGAVTFGVTLRQAPTAVPPPLPKTPPRAEPPPSAAPAAVKPPATTPAPVATPRAAAAAAGRTPSTSEAEAAELLGVPPGAPPHEIRRKYQKIYNDYQIRLTNAPTASLKRMYQKNLQELKAAVEVLAPGLLEKDGR